MVNDTGTTVQGCKISWKA